MCPGGCAGVQILGRFFPRKVQKQGQEQRVIVRVKVDDAPNSLL